MKQLPSEIKVIFTTAYEEYAVRAFRLAAYDYLLKPIDKQELVEVVDRLMEESNPDRDRIQMDLLQQLIRSQEKTRKIAINTSDSLHVVNMDEILYLTSQKSYTRFQLDDTTLLATKPISFYEDLLQHQRFFRVHRSHIVNLARARVYKKRKMEVILDDGSVIEVARNRKDELLQNLSSI